MLHTETFEKKAVTTFELVNRTDSEYVQKGTERYPNPIHLNSPKTKMVSMRSYYCLGDGRGYAETQYVEGAPTIFIDDLYVDKDGKFHSKSEKKQDAWEIHSGLKSLGYNLKDQYRRSIIKNICFEFGILNLDKYGGDPTLLNYINCHEDNVNAPNAKYNRRGASKIWAFRCVVQEEKASVKLDTLDVESDALNYVASLRTKTSKGFEFTLANKNKINATLRILDINHGLQEEDYNQKLLAIKGLANTQPETFMSIVNESLGDLKISIAKAVEMKVLRMSGKEIMLVVGEKNSKLEQRKILITSTSDTMEQADELAYYFLTPAGATDCRDFTLLLEAAISR